MPVVCVYDSNTRCRPWNHKSPLPQDFLACAINTNINRETIEIGEAALYQYHKEPEFPCKCLTFMWPRSIQKNFTNNKNVSTFVQSILNYEMHPHDSRYHWAAKAQIYQVSGNFDIFGRHKVQCVLRHSRHQNEIHEMIVARMQCSELRPVRQPTGE